MRVLYNLLLVINVWHDKCSMHSIILYYFIDLFYICNIQWNNKETDWLIDWLTIFKPPASPPRPHTIWAQTASQPPTTTELHSLSSLLRTVQSFLSMSNIQNLCHTLRSSAANGQRSPLKNHAGASCCCCLFLESNQPRSSDGSVEW